MATPPERTEHPEEPTAGNTVQLTRSEEREVRKRTGLRAAVVFETVRREGETELRRPATALAFSALAAGLSMGFSLIATGILRAHLPDAPWRPLVDNLGYTLGFLIVVLGRQQLFTENTVTVILPLLDDPDHGRTLLKVARLWGIVLLFNIAGAGIFAFLLAHGHAFDAPVRDAFAQIGMQTLAPSSGTILLRGIYAGWLIALMVWLLPSADTQKAWIILIVTYVVGAAGLSHIVAGSVEALYVVALGAASPGTFLFHFLLPVFIGNCIGGVALVSLLNYGQVAPEGNDEGVEDS